MIAKLKLLSKSEACERLSVSSSTFDGLRKDQGFPQPVNISVNGRKQLRWLEAEIELARFEFSGIRRSEVDRFREK